jgi:hypothetical protein
MSGTGSMTPDVPAVPPPGTTTTYRPPVYTLLSPAEYAQILGINPIQFMSAMALTYFPNTGGTDRWVQYAWQDDTKVSRDELATEIHRTEGEIASVLRAWPGPLWTEDEDPQFHRTEYVGQYGHSPDGSMKSVKLNYGQFIEGGKRTKTLVDTVTVAGGDLEYLDLDSDGFNETARITVSTSLTDACELRLYFSDEDGDQEWEIRPLKSRSISGGVFVATVDAWLLIKPELLAALPGTSVSGFQPIDAEDSDNYVTSLEVYRVYNDPEEQCTLLWPGTDTCVCGGTGCAVCGFETQAACMVSKDGPAGMVSIVPATYSNGSWTEANFTQGYEPRKVRASYKSGYQELDRSGCMSVPRDIATAITYMTTARLSRPLCTSSETLRKREEELKEDLVFISSGGDATRFVTKEVLTCPFGTRYGELEAWRIIKARLRVPNEINVDVAVV